MDELKSKTCCICESEFTAYGHNPEPFDGRIGYCCDDCNDRFVVPVRIMWGRTGKSAPLEMLKALAERGAMIVASNKLAKEMYDARMKGDVD